MLIDIDDNAGFCFGVTNAINKAEAEIKSSGKLFCLGEMVHNEQETGRLSKSGMVTVSYNDLKNLQNQKVLFRAHGEPPSIYSLAHKYNISVIDATCPIVLKLQQRIKSDALRYGSNSQTVIFAKKDHPETTGLNGQINNTAVIISGCEDIDKIDFDKDILLYSQTTMNVDDYNLVAEKIELKIKNENRDVRLYKFDTVCKSVASRVAKLSDYVSHFDVILFCGGKNSSNGKYLFQACLKVNKSTYYIGKKEDLKREMFLGKNSIGITGATSTPRWLLQDIKDMIVEQLK